MSISSTSGAEFLFTDLWVDPSTLLKRPTKRLVPNSFIDNDPPVYSAHPAASELTFDGDEDAKELGAAPLILRSELQRRRTADLLGVDVQVDVEEANEIIKSYVVEVAIPTRPDRTPIWMACAGAVSLMAIGYLLAYFLH